jgi:dTDP-glucose 4,6-dehydratase
MEVEAAMKILVTGGGGFIGSHLCEALLDAGHDVRALVRYKSDGSAGWLEEPYAYHIHRGDVQDPVSIYDAMFGCKAVIHLAALIGIPYSFRSPLSYVRTNVEGTYNVLQEARRSPAVERVIIVSSSEVFGEARAESMDEDHPRRARSPYAASKIAAEELAFSYRAAYGLPVTVARPFNVFGPRQSLRAVIPTIFAQCFAGSPEIKLGNLKSRRDYTFVWDLCAALIRLLEVDEPPKVVNIGTGKTWPIGELAGKIISLTGSGARIIEDRERKRAESAEVWTLCADARKMRELGWDPKVGLVEGLERTAAWFREFRPADPGAYHV